MMEVCVTWDLLPGVNQETYTAWAKRAVSTTLKQPGLVEFRAHRNVLGTPQVRTTAVWKAGADWIAFSEGEWQSVEQGLRGLATNIRLEIWGPSALVPEPLRPAK